MDGPFKGPSSYHRLCRWLLIQITLGATAHTINSDVLDRDTDRPLAVAHVWGDLP
jgi:hypothetical protein